MKKVVFLLFLGAIVLASCEKDPDFSRLDEEFIAYTKKDASFTFANKRVCVADTIMAITPDATNPKWYNSTSLQITQKIKDNYKALGYTIVDQKDARVDTNSDGINDSWNTDYVVWVLAVKDMETVIYAYDPYYWGGGWYDWSYWWWGGYYPYYPYYPYISGYTYDVGTTVISMTDVTVRPNAPSTGSDGGYPVRWNAVLTGLLGTGNDLGYELSGIDDVFAQSPYLSVK